jgi:E3 ubiquitin-protein ligase CHFR
MQKQHGDWMKVFLLATHFVAIGEKGSTPNLASINIHPSENLHAVGAPSTTKCDLCHVYFCGIGVQGRCLAAPLASQHPHGMSDISDLIQSSEVYDCFEENAYEVEILLDYITSQRLTPRHIYGEVCFCKHARLLPSGLTSQSQIIIHIQSQPEAFAPLIELNLFAAPGTDPNPESPRNLICRMCAADVLLWGLREWWIRERQKGFLSEDVLKRQDCSQGQQCDRQNDLGEPPLPSYGTLFLPLTFDSASKRMRENVRVVSCHQ